MTTDQDPRNDPARLIRIGANVAGVLVGPIDAILNQSSTALAKAMTRLSERAAEVRQHIELPTERARRVEELRAPALDAYRAHQRTLSQHAARIKALKSSCWVQRSELQSGHTQRVDELLWMKFQGLSLSAKTQLVAKCMADPVANQRWCEALMRGPAELLDIDAAQREHLRQAVNLVFDPQGCESTAVQVEQLELAQRALDLSAGVLNVELPGSAAELREPLPPESEKPPSYVIPEHVLVDLRTGGALTRKAPNEMAAS